ncbi:MAG TPA: outer membrane beta-barrel protein [Pyrinomonadaceae bacterium]|nr:outer membrane beta-barrel protein [Pyrinomonadaceae bacterium]
MRRDAHLTTALTILTLLFFSATREARAQSDDAPKAEVGVQFTSLSLTPPEDFLGTENKPGFGARFTYNLTDSVAVEAEGNFFPTKSRPGISVGGRASQLQAGVKAGKRFEKFGVFFKARPGFVSFDDALQIDAEQISIDQTPFLIPRVTRVRRTHFSMDVGGVLELYPTRRTMLRFDAGDTIIRYGERNDFDSFPLVPALTRAPSEVKHNFQFTAGVGYRFGGGEDGGPGAGAADDVPDGTRKFEVGVQFSSLGLNEPDRSFGGGVIFGGLGVNTEAGFGARLGYNFNEHVAVEAEGNFFPRRRFSDTTQGGYPVQLQAGAKVGRRFERFGLFFKARPGFVGFTDVLELERVETAIFGGEPFPFPVFSSHWKNYFSMDLGGVFEVYPTRRVLARFDFGDTIIRYGQRRDFGFFGGQFVEFNLPSETKHNFQFTAGLGYRF